MSGNFGSGFHALPDYAGVRCRATLDSDNSFVAGSLTPRASTESCLSGLLQAQALSIKTYISSQRLPYPSRKGILSADDQGIRQ